MDKIYYFLLNISHQEMISYYQGVARNIQLTTECGLRLQLPASHFRPFMTHNGIQGRFRLVIDQNNKFINLNKYN